MPSEREWIINILLGVVALALFITANAMGHNDEVIEQQHYCKMVESGAWPNYQNIDCGGTYE
ncbi:MAG: hypothetical protein JKY67_08365 [Pseudomonadales bacterium]|nr:hypothetical protein [Pseudomonadales bacterium]